MAENVTPVVLEIKDFEPREVMMVDYKFDQATDREGQIAGIPRGGKVTIRVKAMNDGNNQLIQWMLDPTSPKDFSVKFVNTVDGVCEHRRRCSHEGVERHQLLLHQLRREVGGRPAAL